ncbi:MULTISPECIES: hypothetical protein [unclassified Providencia]|uniref:hypothetical protein n=1 Tax=unclassified Providencia TaxID=2633465 RepID=UPI0023493BE5|nr:MULTISPECIES: hypothetical protein [unclassified Providencia]
MAASNSRRLSAVGLDTRYCSISARERGKGQAVIPVYRRLRLITLYAINSSFMTPSKFGAGISGSPNRFRFHLALSPCRPPNSVSHF